MANCLEGAPGWLRRDDSPLSASIAGKSPESLAREDKCAAQFEEYLNSFRINAAPMLRLTDSADVNLESLERIAKYFCIPVNVEEREREFVKQRPYMRRILSRPKNSLMMPPQNDGAQPA
jgi:hypothetical protein